MSGGAQPCSSLEWPYPVRYEERSQHSTDVLVIGGGIAGCMAAIAAAEHGASVILVDKGAIVRSGAGGTGADHWQFVTDTPCCGVTAEELTEALIDNTGGYTNGISRFIAAREGYNTLQDLERMGAKVRDSEDEFEGAPFRDEQTKLLFAYDYKNRYTIRIWGAAYKPLLAARCRKLGVKVFERSQITSLLTVEEEGENRVVGATGLNIRTGEFYIFKAKSSIIACSRPQRNWIFNSEQRGLCNYRPGVNAGNGHAIAWRAGAEFTMMENSCVPGGLSDPLVYPYYGTGNPNNTWFPCNMVDANGKLIPWQDRDGRILDTVLERCMPAPDQKFFLAGGGTAMINGPKKHEYLGPSIIKDLPERVKSGEYELPLYADLSSMPDYERRVIWGVMVGNEGKTKIPIIKTYTDAGFDPDKHQLQGYQMLRGEMRSRGHNPAERTFGESGLAGGLVVDWNLQTSLKGLYAAGDSLFAAEGFAHAATTGRWAGRHAAAAAMHAEHAEPGADQVEQEIGRVYGPVRREDGLEWKEANSGICKVMQVYCGENRNATLFTIGLEWLNEMRESDEWQLYASDPHKLGRCIDVMDIRTTSEMILHACLARRASSVFLDFKRTDCPETDPPDWRKWITLRRRGGKVEIGERPIDYWLREPCSSSYEENYRNHLESAN